MRNLKWHLLGFALALQLLLAPGSCMAEQVYQVTEAELTKLESNIKELATINQQQKSMLKQARFDLEELSIALNECKKELTEAKLSLASANKSLEQYAAEEKSKRLRIKRQRNFAYSLTAALVVGFIYKSNH